MRNTHKIRCSIKHKDRIYFKNFEFSSFPKNVAKNFSRKWGKILLDSTKKSATYAPKTTSKRAVQKRAEAAVDLIGNKISDKITRTSSQSATSKSITPAQTDKTSIEMKKKEKNRKKSMYQQKNDNELLMNLDYYEYEHMWAEQKLKK